MALQPGQVQPAAEGDNAAAPACDAAPTALAESGPPPPPPVDARAIARLRAKIVRVYRRRNPDRLRGINWLMSRYQGREHDLFKSICEKYDVDPEGAPSDSEPEEPQTAP
eukprot:3595906-Alexandrium_andersonii.AAC.1